MSVAAARPELVTDAVPRRRPRWIELATSTNHKQVGQLYIGTASVFAVAALVELVMMRLQLAVPENTLIQPQIFNQVLSAYGATALVLFAIPLALGLFSYVVPLQIGSRGVAFPRLGSLSWWLYLAGGIAMYESFLYKPSEGGVNPMPPLSEVLYLPNNGVDHWIIGVGLALLGFTLFAINMIVTVRRMRAPGMAWRRMPIFAWAGTVCSYVLVVTGPVMLAALTMLMYDRHFSGVFFNPGGGGAPILWQHMSWLFFTGGYFVVLITAFGAISEILPTLARRPGLSRLWVGGSLVAIGVLGPLAWMQNMYSAPIHTGFIYAAMIAGSLIAIPVGILLYNWITTLSKGAISLRAPMLFALGAISTITIGLSAELVQTVIPAGWQLGSTEYASAATHYALVGGAVFGGFAALYYWFPKMTGRTMSEGLGRASFWTTLIGVNVAFAPMLLAGLHGQPTDIFKYFQGNGLDAYNLISTIGTGLLGLGLLMTLANAARSVHGGVRAGHDPWGGSTLEWFALSPPPEHNFDLLPDVRSPEPLRDIREALARRGG